MSHGHQMDPSRLAEAVLADIGSVFNKIPQSGEHPATQLAASIAKHRKKNVVLYGVGREGLIMRAFAMRLYHLGLQAHVVGDMTCPPLSEDDLFIASAGPGGFSTVDALLGVADKARAVTLVITAQKDGSSAARAQQIVYLPAQTMANDMSTESLGAGVSIASGEETEESDPGPAHSELLPMGSVFEGALFVLFEMVVILLRPLLRKTLESMRARHTNLE